MSADKSIVAINGSAITERDLFSAVDGVIIELNQNGNIQKAASVLNALDKLDNVTGKVKAKLLWGMSEWNNQTKAQEDFADYVLSTTSIRNRKTVLEYVNVWKQIDAENIPKNIQQKPMRDLVPISNMLAQGHEPTKKDWISIDLASNSSELSEVIRKIKGKKPRKSARVNQMERDGSLYTWKDNIRKYVGFLDVKEAETDKDVAEAIEQILAGKPIIRK